jgi:DNA-binding protein/PTS system, IIA component
MKDKTLTIEEAANYLRVSERTVRDLVSRGEIPCEQTGTTLQFQRSDIEKWVNSKSCGTTQSDITPDTIRVSDIISPERIVFTNCTSKCDVLETLIDKLAKTPQVKERALIHDAIMKRELLGSTALGRKIAIPHARIDSVSDLIVALAISQKDITDFDAIDGEPVRLVFMIVANTNQQTYYLQVLSRLSLSLKDDDFVQKLINCKSEQEAYELLCL